MQFTKMHACGNDFIVIDTFNNRINDPCAFTAEYCSRHYGIGADGVLLVGPSDKADISMRIINADGSEAQMCGNGVRCAAKFAYDKKLCTGEKISVETGAGVLDISVTTGKDGKVCSVTVDMGIADTDPAHYPLLSDSNRIAPEIDGRTVNYFCVNTGVPHAVTFDILPDDEQLRKLGTLTEHHPLFPERTNVCFCRADSNQQITMRVWERGCGITLACGTGSCAALFAGHALGLCAREADIILDGGTIHNVLADNGHIMMTGPAVTIFEGIINI